MPRNNKAPRHTATIYVRTTPRQLERINVARGDEPASVYIRRALDQALDRDERAAMVRAADLRALAAAASPDRAPLELHTRPTKGRAP